jgi:hypothetical protein
MFQLTAATGVNRPARRVTLAAEWLAVILRLIALTASGRCQCGIWGIRSGPLPISSVGRPVINGSHLDRRQRRLLHRRIRLRQTVSIHPRSKRLPGVRLRRWGNLATDKPERTQVGGGSS